VYTKLIMAKQPSKKTKNQLSNRAQVGLGMLVLLALISIPFFTNIPLMITLQVVLVTLGIGALSGVISMGVLQVIFATILGISASGTILQAHIEYIKPLFFLMLFGLIAGTYAGRIIAQRFLPYENKVFQSVVSSIAVLILLSLSIVIPFNLTSSTPLIPLLAVAAIAVITGYLGSVLSDNKKLRYRKPLLCGLILVSVIVIAVTLPRWPAVLMVWLLDIFCGLFIYAIFRQANLKHRS